MADKLVKSDSSVGTMNKNDNVETSARIVSRVIHEYDIISDSEKLNVTKSDNSNLKSQIRDVDVSQKKGNNSTGTVGNINVLQMQAENKQECLEQGLKLPVSEREQEYKDSDSTNSLEDQLETSCPRVNCPERIVSFFFRTMDLYGTAPASM